MRRAIAKSFIGQQSRDAKFRTRSRDKQRSTHLDHFFVTLSLTLCALSITRPIQAEEQQAPGAPVLDLGALASLASNIGSNPQIMSMVSSLVAPKPSTGQQATSGVPSQQADASAPTSGVQSNQDTGQAVVAQADSSVALRRQPPQEPGNNGAAKTKQQQQQPPAQPQDSPQATSPMNNLFSLVPNMLSSLSSGAGGAAIANLASSLGPLGNMLGLGKQPTQQAPVQQQQAQQQPAQQQPPSAPTSATGQQPAAPAPEGATNQQQAPGVVQGASIGTANPAQSVINQVLTAYISGQIPNELIQLGLSGRVPPQIIELALSGQVPSPIIQMIITGQVPMSTINTFLSTMQANGASGLSIPAAAGSAIGPAYKSVGRTPALESLTGNVFSTTRNLFESLFGLARLRPFDPNQPQQQQQGGAINVPTLLGSFPLRIPTLPNMRSLGQLVGGTISSVSSMIPF